MGEPKTAKERQIATRGKLKKGNAAYKAYLEKDRFRKAEQRKRQREKMSKKKHEEYKIKERTRDNVLLDPRQ